MKGTLMDANRCRVPRGFRVFKPNKQAAGKICTTPNAPVIHLKKKSTVR